MPTASPAQADCLADDNLLVEILRRLPTLRDLSHTACCCSIWRTASYSDALWRPLLARRFPEASQLEDVADCRPLYARMLRADPNSHRRHVSRLEDYQFLVRISFEGEGVFAASFHGRAALQTRLLAPRRWYNIMNGDFGWEDETVLAAEADPRNPQWLMDFDIDWLVDEMASLYGEREDPRLAFVGDGTADARALVDLCEEYKCVRHIERDYAPRLMLRPLTSDRSPDRSLRACAHQPLPWQLGDAQGLGGEVQVPARHERLPCERPAHGHTLQTPDHLP